MKEYIWQLAAGVGLMTAGFGVLFGLRMLPPDPSALNTFNYGFLGGAAGYTLGFTSVVLAFLMAISTKAVKA